VTTYAPIGQKAPHPARELAQVHPCILSDSSRNRLNLPPDCEGETIPQRDDPAKTKEKYKYLVPQEKVAIFRRRGVDAVRLIFDLKKNQGDSFTILR
jgi:hypothetical protein